MTTVPGTAIVGAEPCKYYSKGRCRFGSACKWRHDVGDTVTEQAFNASSQTQRRVINGGTDRAEEESKDSNGDEVGAGSHKRSRRRRAAAQTLQTPDEPEPDDALPPPSRQTNATQTPLPSSSTPKSAPKRGELPCKAWKAGSCAKGNKCWYAHDPQVQEQERLRRQQENERIAARREAERLRREEEQRRREEEQRRREEDAERLRLQEAERLLQEEARQEAIRQEAARLEEARRLAHEQARLAREARQREVEAAQEAERRERMAEVARQEMARTLQSVVSGSIITFGAGLEICNVTTGFESCTVKVKGLPLDARADEVVAFFTQQGIATTRFQLLCIRRVDNKQEAEVVIDADSAEAIAAGLDGIEFRDEMLSFEVGAHDAGGGMHASDGQDANVLVISWRLPSDRYILQYDTIDTCRAKVRELDRRIFMGRRLKAEINTLPPGRVVRSFRAESVKLSNVPVDVPSKDIQELTESYSVRRLDFKGTANGTANGTEESIRRLRQGIQELHDVTLHNLSLGRGFPRVDGVIEVRATLDSWDEARRVHDHLGGRALWYLGNVTPWFRLRDPILYVVTIPCEQYAAQRAQWTALIASITDKKACRLVVLEQGNVVRIRLMGAAKQSVGALKVRVESLLAGEPVEGWHRSLGYSKSAFLRRVPQETGACLRADWRLQALKVYGTPEAVERARAMVNTELERLSAAEYVVNLKRQSVSFFVRRGISALKEIIGEDNVQFAAAAGRITITGGEEARHALSRLIDESLSGVHPLPDPSSTEQTCPICYDTISSPLELGCGHVYCVACMRHFLTSAVDSDQFPLLCMGDETRCRSPIPIATIQRFLTPAPFNRLLEVVYAAHLARHPQTFKYCTTPDCTQIYRAADGLARSRQCPSCFAAICTGCHTEPHEGMDCAEAKAHRDPLEVERLTEEWMASQGGRVRKCPSCAVLIEKTEGCNHMSCRCGKHICWRCMRVFDNGEAVYVHMRGDHGGYYDEDPIAAVRVDYAEQEAVLRQAAALRAQHRDQAINPLADHRDQMRAEENRLLAQQQAIQRREEEAREIARAERWQREEILWQEHEARRQVQEEQQRHLQQQRARRQEQQGGGWCCVM